MNNYYETYGGGQNISPTGVNGTDNITFNYYQRILLEKIMGVFKFENIPDTWNKQYLLHILLTEGLVIACKTQQGNFALRGSAYNLNVYLEPLKARVTSNNIVMFDGSIGVDCEIIYLRPYLNAVYLGVMDIVNRYAQKLASAEGSLDMTIINSRVSHIFRGKTTAELKSYQKMYDDITNGKPSAFLLEDVNELENKPTNQIDLLNVKNTFVGRELMELRRSLMNEFLTNVGIDNANTDKRERLNAEEVNVNNTETKCMANYWLGNINDCLTRVNALFGFNISCSLDVGNEVVEDELL